MHPAFAQARNIHMSLSGSLEDIGVPVKYPLDRVDMTIDPDCFSGDLLCPGHFVLGKRGQNPHQQEQHFLFHSLKLSRKTADENSVGESYLDERLNALRRSQNADGGWPYFPGKQSWLEPTAWAALALHGEPASDRAWKLLRSWQLADGSWRPSADVQISTWGTALCITIACVRGEYDDSFRKGVAWMLGISGKESVLWRRALASTGLFATDRDPKFKGWPWKPDTSSWVEPTAHSLVALKKAAPHFESGELKNRVQLGHGQLLDVRGSDGGWNYGSRAALGIDLPSYPETTGLALIGLQDGPDVAKSIARAKQMLAETRSPLARAWLRIALLLHGQDAPLAEGRSPDLMITAIEALSCENYKFLKTGAEA